MAGSAVSRRHSGGSWPAPGERRAAGSGGAAARLTHPSRRFRSPHPTTLRFFLSALKQGAKSRMIVGIAAASASWASSPPRSWPRRQTSSACFTYPGIDSRPLDEMAEEISTEKHAKENAQEEHRHAHRDQYVERAWIERTG